MFNHYFPGDNIGVPVLLFSGSAALGAPFSHTFPDHCRHLLEQLNIQRYYGAFCDVIVRIEDYDFKVDKCTDLNDRFYCNHTRVIMAFLG